MKINLQTLVAHVKETALILKPNGGLTRGTLLKLGYEYWEKTTAMSPTKSEKDDIRKAIQDDLNMGGTIKAYEVVVADKNYSRLTGNGELIAGRTIKTIDTRQKSLENQVKEVWSLMNAHMDFRAKTPLYEGSEAEIAKTIRLQNAIYSRLYQLDASEFKTRVEKKMAAWFPAKQTVQDTVAPIVAEDRPEAEPVVA